MRTTPLHPIVQRLALLPLLVALFALAGAWLASGTASAAPRVIVFEEPTIGPEAPGPQPQEPTQPTEPTKPTEPTEPQQPQPGLVIKALPDCERTPGIRYEIIPVNQPYELTDYHALTGPSGAVHAGQSGFIASGEGVFTVSGHAVFGEKKFDSAKVDVTVKCDKPGKPEIPVDKPRPGKPNFTG